MYKAGKDGAAGLISTMKEYFSTFGIAEQVTSDGGSQYTSHSTQKFFSDWGISHRMLSSYFPHSNQRAEQGVKSAKRMAVSKWTDSCAHFYFIGTHQIGTLVSVQHK